MKTVILPGSQQIPAQSIQTQSQQQQPQHPPRTNIFVQLSSSIEACHNATPLYKNNVRHLIDCVQNDLNGPAPE